MSGAPIDPSGFPQLSNDRRALPSASTISALSNIDILDAIFVYFDYAPFHGIEETPNTVAIHIYAPYVRRLYALSLDIRLSKHAEITEEGWMSVIRALGDQPLFPNLQTLYWLMERPTAEMPQIKALLSPSIKVLKLSCHVELETEQRPVEIQEAWKPHLQQLIEALPERVPELVDLAFYTKDLDARLVLDPLSLSYPASLRTLALSSSPQRTRISFGPRSLLPLMRFATIQSLRLALPIADVAIDDRMPEIRLDNLTELCIVYHRGYRCALDAISSSNLRELKVSDVQCFIPSSFQSTCATWVRSFPRLESINCELASVHVGRVASRWPVFTLFQPLLALPRMRKVCITFTSWIPIEITDHDLITFAQAWPSIEQLHLAPTAVDLSRLQTGLPSLVALSAHCPHLSDLRMVQLVIREDDIANLPPEPPNPLHALRTVKLNFGMKPATYRLIRDMIFPNLDQKPDARDGLYRD
ncbi:hypothetical protein ACG7TL_005491 [Trametes sanguinea]